MQERATGIILRTRPLTETSLIVQWLTSEHGRLSTVAKGARRPKSPFAGKLDLFYEADFSFVRSRQSELHTLREVVIGEIHGTIRQDLTRLSAAAYGAVLIEQGTERETPVTEFHAIMKELLAVLSTRSPCTALVFALELKVLNALGAMPPLETALHESEQTWNALTTLPFAAAWELPIAQPLLKDLSSVLRRAIGTTFGRLPPQRERLIQALSNH